ncbi:putative HTH-type transcriptional regulator YusO [Thermotalea metallivorans]|uniref:HTH-type transcriptional regulator SarZ n=1 Tax=Thermotalea metallivorans TaxID=520762 RepID=A0A140L7R9_9FIRM|nr:putative HTH-type transcriptional regulator YusO [Thermotalea metallivorans]
MDEVKLMHKLIDIFKYKEEYQMETSGLHPQDMYVLERIYFKEKARVMDIAKTYHIPPSTLTGIMDRLYEKKYIERIRSQEDRRVVEIVVTDEGKKIVEQHIREDRSFVKNFFNTLEPEKRGEFRSLLAELVSNVDKETLFVEKGDDI